MKKYDKYKDSGIEWIGKIPEHWEVKRIKQVTKYEIGGTPSRTKMEYFEGENLWVSIADLNGKDIINDTEEKITDKAIEDSNCKKIPKGSLLYSFKLSVGLTAFAGQELYTNEAIAAFLPTSKINLNYLRNIVTVGFENNARENIYGAKLFNQRTLNDAPLISPPKEEQIIISDYLDEGTKKLNKVIENKKIQIELLRENEKIIINQQIHYAHKNYKSRRIKFSVKTTKGMAFKSTIFKEKGVVVVKATDLKNSTIVINSDCFVEEKVALNFEVVRLFSGDIIMSTVGSWPWVFNSAVGQIAVVPNEFDGALLNQNTVRLEPDLSVWNKKYLYYLFISNKYRSYLDVGAHGTANQASLSLRYILDFYHNIPAISDQEKISKKISMAIDMIRNGIQILHTEISKLEEYKKILINDVVTGKMKVTA